ncbi:hypothetical protein PLESTB_001179300 [Pleodorina starrii]|uniref:Uncharacterized protein n=1 Tax=Pleodorina starrii TaxID=330485 RepID=A0A9W6BSS4_9CHLO|nr:hypothetical protein PLESTB_001179300 [Pleodorina starrii]GLC64901.1 hypothetical protein PLESTF_000219700 [Pleodorina starrii]
MEAGAAPKEAAARPLMAPDGPIIGAAIRKVLQGAIQLLLRAAARLRRLLRALARQPGLLVSALLRAPRSLAEFVRYLLSSKPVRLLVAAAASIVCITLQYRRPTIANIHLSSSISLLFGMIKLQGSLSVQLGPPEPRTPAEQPTEPQNEELRINCPKDLKESIVRFLESQAARDFAAASPAAFRELSSPQRRDVEKGEEEEGEENEEEQLGDQPLAPFEEPPTIGVVAAADAAEAEAEAGLPVGELGCGGDVQSSSAEADDASAAAAAVVLSSFEALLPSTPPLGRSPQTQAAAAAVGGGTSGNAEGCAHPAAADPAFLASLGPSAADAGPALDRSDYLSLMSYAASYRPSRAALDSPRAGLATHGSSAGFHDSYGPYSGTGSSAESEAAAAAAAVAEATAPAAGAGAGGGGLSRKTPDSILGLRNLGLEGWAESSRRWESRYVEE